jgi:hypothetical protein
VSHLLIEREVGGNKGRRKKERKKEMRMIMRVS